MSSNTGSKIGSDIKSAVKGIHGAGEALRGNINQSVDTAFNDKSGQVKNEAVAERGVNEMENSDAMAGATHGVRTGGITGGTTTSAGAHSGAVGNMQSNPAASSNMASEPTTRTERY